MKVQLPSPPAADTIGPGMEASLAARSDASGRVHPRGRKWPLSLQISERKVLLVGGDASAWCVAVLIVAFAHLPHMTIGFSRRIVASVLAAALLWCIWAWVNGAYDVEVASQLNTILPVLGKTAIAQTLSVVVIAFLSGGSVGRLGWALWIVIAFGLTGFWRAIYLSLFTLPVFSRRILFATSDDFAVELAALTHRKWAGHYEVAGYAHSVPQHPPRADGSTANEAGSMSLVEIARLLSVQEVVVGSRAFDDRTELENLVECCNYGIKITSAPDLFEQLTRRVALHQIDHRWIVDLGNGAAQKRSYSGAKRLIDICLASVGLVVLAVILPFVAVAIWLESGPPIFYRQVRIGLHGRPLALVKFRTMRQDAERDNHPRWAVPDDERITRVGRFLRRARLDELPQVINIMRGEMTTVGPRPERPEFFWELNRTIPFFRTRLTVKPGLTGWAQVNNGYVSSVEDAITKLEYDLYYIKHQSFLLDALIVLRTFGVLARLGGR